MAKRVVSLLGATGAVGEELLRLLEDRSLEVGELRAFASDASDGRTVEFAGAEIQVEPVEPRRVLFSGERAVDLVLSAAPGALAPLLPTLREVDVPLVDCTGLLELDPHVPLHVPGDALPAGARIVAVPRGPAAALALALRPIAEAGGLRSLVAVTLESAGGAGRRGVGELSEQTLELLNSMGGEIAEEAEVFPRPLAFDVLPLIGAALAGGDSEEESALASVLARVLGAAAPAIEATRVRVPVFGGSLVCAHARTARPLSAAQARELWSKAPGLEVLPDDELPTARSAVARDGVLVGRIRSGEDAGGPRLAFVLAFDELRRGSALSMVEAAEALLERS